MAEKSYRIGIAGASGYLGLELLRLCAQHPNFEVVVATGETQAGEQLADVYPSLTAAYPDLAYVPTDADAFDGLDVAFLALPHGTSQDLVPDLRKRVGKIVDLAADFRLKDASLYPTWYGAEHTNPQLLGEFRFGLPELFRDELAGADLVAAAGCYVTAASLALAPLIRAGVIETSGIIVDAAGGISGAGKAPKPGYHYPAANESFAAYGLLDHRHTPEIEQAIGGQVLFTPHLAPMTRGILATCYARPTSSSGAEPQAILRDFYAAEPFVRVTNEPPATKATYGANTAQLTARYDERTGWILVLCALDNLVKGGSGQAIQCANLVLGLDETAGLPLVGTFP